MGSDSGALNPLKLLHFEISDHEILKREDYVVYFLRIKTVTKSVASWTKTISLRYNNFKELHSKLIKVYKNKLPQVPPTRLLRKSKEVINERK